MTFVDLPTELILRILSYLPATDIASCSLCSRLLHSVAEDSVELQYIIYLHRARLDDNPRSRLTYGEKLGLLKSREKGWASLTPDFVKQVEVPFEPGSVYDLSGDVYILGDSSRTRLHCLTLPSSPEEQVNWRTFHSRDERPIVDFAINLYEHDLIVLVTAPHRSLLQPQQSQSSIELSLHKFSTNVPHPLAKQHVIPLVAADQQWGFPAVNMEIVGDYLTIIASFWRVVRSRCLVSVYNWKTGKSVLRIEGRPNSYSGVIFLTDTLLLLPNVMNSSLEVWRIPTSEDVPAPKVPVIRLELPSLESGYFYAFISCRAEPNPVGSSSSSEASDDTESSSASTSSQAVGPKPQSSSSSTDAESSASHSSDTWYSTKPFHPRPEDSVILFHIRIISANVLEERSELHSLFVHRSAIIKIVEEEEAKHSRESDERPSGVARWFPESIMEEFGEAITGPINGAGPQNLVNGTIQVTDQQPAVTPSTVEASGSTAHLPSIIVPPISPSPNSGPNANTEDTEDTEEGAQASSSSTSDADISARSQRRQAIFESLFRQLQEPPLRTLPWNKWAVPHTFMINSGMGSGSRWITTSCGGRFVLLVPYEDQRNNRSVEFPTIVGGEVLNGLDEFTKLEDETWRMQEEMEKLRKSEELERDEDSEDGSDEDDEDDDDDDDDDEDDQKKSEEQKPFPPSRIMVFDFNPHNVREAEKNPRYGKVVLKPKPEVTEKMKKGKEKLRSSSPSPEPFRRRREFTARLWGLDQSLEEEVASNAGGSEPEEEMHTVTNADEMDGVMHTGLAVLTMPNAVDIDDDDESGLFEWSEDRDQGERQRRDTPFVDRIESHLPCVVTMATTASSLIRGPSPRPGAEPASSSAATEEGMSAFPVLESLNGANGLLADDERILGISTNREEKVGMVNIVHFGA